MEVEKRGEKSMRKECGRRGRTLGERREVGEGRKERREEGE